MIEYSTLQHPAVPLFNEYMKDKYYGDSMSGYAWHAFKAGYESNSRNRLDISQDIGHDDNGWTYNVRLVMQGSAYTVITTRYKCDSPTIGADLEVVVDKVADDGSEFEAGRIYQSKVDNVKRSLQIP